jgi:metal-responsive CopG/Arc/MetJ family transcriptional regulator
MKRRVTVSISKAALDYVDHSIGKRGPSRSQVIESLIRESWRRKREGQLAALARDFFATQALPQEVEEREDWLQMSLETQERDG